MSKVLRIVAVIAGVVAIVATGGAALAGAGTFLGASAGTLTTIAGIAGVVGAAASLGAQLLAKPPGPQSARGSVTQTILDQNALQPYVMGEGLVGGAVRHDVAYGATLSDVPNPYRWIPIVYSGGGPVQSITPYVDQGPIGAYYTGFLNIDTQLGDLPEATALVPPFGAAPGWTSASKLSGQAAIGWNYKFDKAGKVFGSGLPQMGAYGQWTKCYDPRLDSTFPGGSGAHRLGTESTYSWTENPALCAATYAYGRYQNGKRTIGPGLPADAIDWVNIAAWANVCTANSWRLFGIVYEPGDRWNNIKDIAAAGGAIPVISGGVLSFHYSAPRISVDTITEADLSGEDMSVTAMASYRDRLNTVVPKYRSPDHNWELVNAEAIGIAAYIAEDGETKQAEWTFNFVKNKDQAAQLAHYVLADRRELQPIVISCNPWVRTLNPGDAVDLVLPSLGLNTQAVILRREFNVESLTVQLTLVGETNAKHALALGRTGTAPPTPTLGQTGQARDDIIAAANQTGIAVTGTKTVSVAYDYTGAVKAGQLPLVANFKMVTAANTDITASTTWTAITKSGVATYSIGAATGVLTVTALSLDAVIEVSGVYGGQTRAATLTLFRTLDAPPVSGAAGGTSASTSISTSGITTSYGTSPTGLMSVVAGAAGQVACTADVRFYRTTNGTSEAYGKWQWRVVGGSYADIAAEVISDFPAERAVGLNEPGSLMVNMTKTGLTNGTIYEFQLLLRSTSGTLAAFGTAATVGS